MAGLMHAMPIRHTIDFWDTDRHHHDHIEHIKLRLVATHAPWPDAVFTAMITHHTEGQTFDFLATLTTPTATINASFAGISNSDLASCIATQAFANELMQLLPTAANRPGFSYPSRSAILTLNLENYLTGTLDDESDANTRLRQCCITCNQGDTNIPQNTLPADLLADVHAISNKTRELIATIPAFITEPPKPRFIDPFDSAARAKAEASVAFLANTR